MPPPGPRPVPAPVGRLRVLEVIKGLGHGGAEQLLVDTVAHGDRDSFDYEVAYVLEQASDLVPALRAVGIPVHALGATRSIDASWLPAFRRVIVRGRYDIVHFHLPYSAALGRLVVATLPPRSRPVTVYTEHSLWSKVSPATKALNRATVSRDGALIAVSPAAHAALPDRLRPRARVIVHGVDLDRSSATIAASDRVRAEVRADLGVRQGPVLVVTVANLRSEKGYDVLLDAARRTVDRQKGVRFAAAGQGTLLADLTARRDELGLEGVFQFLGHRGDALRLLAAADIVALPSHQEGLPVVLMEAMSVGAAIVATEVGGVPEVITDQVNGLLVPPGQPGALADALVRLASDAALRHRLGDKARRDSAAFDVSRASREIEDLYRRLVPRTSSLPA